jgi:anti-sigma B factor antagonist
VSLPSPVCRAWEGGVPMTITKDPPSDYTDPPAADDHSTSLPGPAASPGIGPVQDFTFESLRLTIEYPINGVCVITIGGELDMLTAPALQACLQQQLSTSPSHLVVDLQGVSFLDSKGLNCLLQARETTQTANTQLHLAGLVTRAVARPLQVSQLLDLFDTYPTVIHALTAIMD